MSTPNDIARKIAAIRKRREQPVTRRRTSQYGMIVRFATELTAAVGVGLAMGYYLDQWLGTSPLFLLLCMLFGTAAGFVTIKRVNDAYVQEMQKSSDEAQETLDK